MNNLIEDAYRSGDVGDKWGNAIGMAFGICFVLHAAGENVPYHWDFHPGMGAITFDSIREEDAFPDAWLVDYFETGEITVDDLLHAGEVFHRYLNLPSVQALAY